MSMSVRELQVEPVELDLPANELGEGPIWLADRSELVWVDIQRGQVHLADPLTGRARTLELGERVGALAPTTAGGLVVATATGFVHLDPDTGRIRRLANFEPADPTVRMNDGKADPWGSFWAGTMGLDKRPGAGNLYRLDPDLQLTLVQPDVTISNGLDWTDDRATMYFVDTPTQRIDQFTVADGGRDIADRRPFVHLPREQGTPDGLTVDAEGRVWLAIWGGSAVRCFSPSGELEAIIRLPTTHVTSCTFGGPNLDDLYITSAQSELTAEQLAAEPLAGRVFHCRPGATGRPAFRFDDSLARSRP